MGRVFTSYPVLQTVVAGFQGLGDVVPGASNYWGLRAYSLATIGVNAVRLREDGGNTEQDFVTIFGGGLDLAAIATFKGANNLFVAKLYDQVGVIDVEMTTAANQAPFTLNAIGSLPGMTFSLHELVNLAFTITTPASMSTVVKHTASGSYDGFLGGGTSTWELRVNPTGFIESMLNSAALLSTSSGTVPLGSHSTSLCTIGGGNGAFFIDGAASGTYVSAPTFSGAAFRLGCGQQFNAEQWIGLAHEWCLWGSVLTGGNAASLDANQRAYWGF